MARKKIEIFIEIQSEKHFEYILKKSTNRLICAEVYNHCFGSCTALDRLFTTIKLDWTDGKMILLKVPADDIEALHRFRGQSEPIYLFILNGKVTRVVRGVNAIRLAEAARTEIHYFNLENDDVTAVRPNYQIDEMTPDEKEWFDIRDADKKLEITSMIDRREARKAARKKHRAELMVPYIKHLNFVLFWPHCTHAHHELYERWDQNNIIMVGREEVQLTEQSALDVLYEGDAPTNEASMHVLLSAPALAICFRLLDVDKHFVSLVRSILYEEIPQFDPEIPVHEQPPRKTAFDRYKSYSLSREEIWQKRREERVRRKEEEIEKRARRLSEMQRLAKQAIQEAVEAKRLEKEQYKLGLLKAGNLAALDKIDDEFDEEVDIVIPEELPEDIEEEECEIEDENEYIPPPGLLIPGFYAPPNDIAKANGLAILFRKLVIEHVTPLPEHLPPHVLVLLSINHRRLAVDAMRKHRPAVIHMGIFRASSPFDAKHIAYSVRQYDKMTNTNNVSEVKIAFMVSTQVDIPLLELMDLNPVHVSRDEDIGEEECAAVFPVDYGDDYPQFEDFDDFTVLKKKDY